MGLQLAASLSVILGFVFAMLAFGWKTMQFVHRYAPHKIIGIVVVCLALLQVGTRHYVFKVWCINMQMISELYVLQPVVVLHRDKLPASSRM